MNDILCYERTFRKRRKHMNQNEFASFIKAFDHGQALLSHNFYYQAVSIHYLVSIIQSVAIL
jgi:hypothetical protein